jgi:hypothetical protein
VDYVKNRLSYTKSLTGCATCGAKDAGTQLVAAGYQWRGTPQAGDVVVFQPTFRFVDGGGVDRVSGHIAFIENAAYDSRKKTWTITFWGANQQGFKGAAYPRSDSNCNNVTTVMNRTYQEFTSESQRTVSFYRK